MNNKFNEDKEFYVVEKPHRFSQKSFWWTAGEIKEEAEDILNNHEGTPADFDNWDIKDYADIVFCDNNSYRIYDPAEYETAEDFVADVKRFACHYGHNDISEGHFGIELLARDWELATR